MNRVLMLLGLLVLLALANFGYYLWRGWGVITVHAENRPVAEVLLSIEKQGHVKIRSQLDPTTQVRMHVDRVSLQEALETLAAVTDTRWRLTYLFGDAPALSAALGNLGAGQKLGGWKFYHYPLPSMPGEDAPPLEDPRRDPWNVEPVPDGKLSGYLDGGARKVSATFGIPEGWDSQVNPAPKPGPVNQVTAALAKAAGCRIEEFVLLETGRRERRGEEERGEVSGEGGRFRGRDFNPEKIEQRVLAEIAKLPPEKQAAARAELEERKAFFAGIQNLSREERTAKFQELFERPEVQERFEKDRAEREARQSPAQRMARAQRYRERKAQVLGGNKP
jgi:hypothetical protein